MGFADNRFFVPYLNEAVRLLDEGFDAGEIDRVVMQAFKTAVGPFKLMDMSKPVIALHACRTLARMGAFYEPAASLVRKGEAGGNWDTVIPESVAPERGAAILGRIQGAILTAFFEAVDEDVAAPDDFDLGARIGLAWGWQPLAGARTLGRPAVEALLARHFSGRDLPKSVAGLLG